MKTETIEIKRIETKQVTVKIVGDGDLIWHNSDMLNKALQNPCLFSSLLNL